MQAGKARVVLVSGDHGTARYDEVNVMHDWLVAHQVPDDRIFTDHAGFRTLDTMARAAEVFAVGSAIVCTQRFHLGRSLYLARAFGIDAVGVVADRRLYLGVINNAVREAVARAVAVGDVHLWHRGPRFLGNPIPVTGPAAASRDSRNVR